MKMKDTNRPYPLITVVSTNVIPLQAGRPASSRADRDRRGLIVCSKGCASDSGPGSHKISSLGPPSLSDETRCRSDHMSHRCEVEDIVACAHAGDEPFLCVCARVLRL